MDIPVYPDISTPEPDENSSEGVQDNSLQQPESIQAENPQEILHLEHELHMTLEEIARLQNALAEANMKLMSATTSGTAAGQNPSAESLLQPLVKELRQPLVTIKGYLDLLLNESVGPLGAFQRRFVERIQKSVDHLEESFDNFARSNMEEKNEPGLFSQSFSVRKSIESALDIYFPTVKAKEIVLKINIPYEDTRLFNDKENFENILNILLTNATTVINNNGSLSITTEEFLTLSPQEVLITVESSDHIVALAELIPVLPEMYKNQRLTLPGFGLPLEDIVRAINLAQRMDGKIEFFSNSCGAVVAKLRLPLIQGETL